MDGGSVVLGDDDEGLVTGRWLTLPDRGDPVVPGMLHGKGWVALMYARGRMTTAQVMAAVDIARAVALEGVVAASGLRAVDPAALVVDGGNRTSPPLAPVGGLAYADELSRYLWWRVGVRRDPIKGTLRGRRGSLYFDALVVKVVTGEAAPSALDVELGVREGRTRDAVLRLLADYAETFGLTVQKNTA
ncbi:hypothetical protein GAY33_09520 [Azospirillum brasilense]|uniref:hypothetical protein n=1 Tax=Azospirillum argentinense TaxID=2970906 RepID=UPI00190A55D0|nr:hypothetical protein [Azospirillum argentinense]MBK3799462.1 hypothetical protein [Azospirillum argentinense]